MVCDKTRAKAEAKRAACGAIVSAGNAIAVSPIDQHALLHAPMLYACTIVGSKLATAASTMCAKIGTKCCPAPGALATSPTSANAERRTPGDFWSVIDLTIASRTPSGSEATSEAAPAPTPSQIPESKSRAHTTWSGSYPKSVPEFCAVALSDASRACNARRAKVNARANIGAANSCAPNPTPIVTLVTHSRSWYRSTWLSPPLSHFCNRGASNALATAGFFKASPAESASVATASSAHRRFFRPYEATA
mmetsp:Transcript_7144/g.30432  ORF Transcript_7144/g.30432 Transcript_7144/m.30432 type:complete len:250 (+) Transcript_7144:686-1435(+)